MSHRIFFIILSTLTLSACTTIRPIDSSIAPAQSQRFSHEDFDRVLHRFVNDNGRVDYTGLKADSEQFERYYQQVALYSPDNSSSSFKHESDRLAYWINAYNAAVIKTVLSYYPISSIEQVKPPLALFFLPDKTGFFVFQKPSFGRSTTSLYYLENSVIRKRFAEPRVHFALNCASRGCPKLPRYAFNGDQLQQQLDFEARKFFSESRNFKIDHETQTVYLSSILDWYHDDFVDWHQAQYPEQEASLLKYVALYVKPEQASFLRGKGAAYGIEFLPYDWGLNDQKALPK